MIGFLLITHAPLGEAFIKAATHVFQSQPERLEAIDVIADQSLEEVQELARAAISRINDGSGVLVMTDMMGGTPANCCQKLCLQSSENENAIEEKIEVVAGISLPMLLRVISYRHDTLEELVDKAVYGGQHGVVRLTD